MEAAIDKEINKNEPDIDKLVQNLRQRRQEIAHEKEHQNEKNSIVKFAHLYSKSTTGKISEYNMVKKFAGVQEADSKNFISGDMLSVEKLTKSLIQSADAYYAKWRSERMHDEYLDKIA